MTYYTAAKINNKLGITDKTFMQAKAPLDGAKCKWCKLENGSIAVLGRCATHSILLFIPTKVLKHKFYCTATTISHDEWKKLLIRDEEVI